jgi:hypothetical protein
MCTYKLDFVWPLLRYEENRETRLCDVKFVSILGN